MPGSPARFSHWTATPRRRLTQRRSASASSSRTMNTISPARGEPDRVYLITRYFSLKVSDRPLARSSAYICTIADQEPCRSRKRNQHARLRVRIRPAGAPTTRARSPHGFDNPVQICRLRVQYVKGFGSLNPSRRHRISGRIDWVRTIARIGFARVCTFAGTNHYTDRQGRYECARTAAAACGHSFSLTDSPSHVSRYLYVNNSG